MERVEFFVDRPKCEYDFNSCINDSRNNFFGGTSGLDGGAGRGLRAVENFAEFLSQGADIVLAEGIKKGDVVEQSEDGILLKKTGCYLVLTSVSGDVGKFALTLDGETLRGSENVCGENKRKNGAYVVQTRGANGILRFVRLSGVKCPCDVHIIVVEIR